MLGQMNFPPKWINKVQSSSSVQITECERRCAQLSAELIQTDYTVIH